MKPHKNFRVTASLAVSHTLFLLTAIIIALAIYPTQTAQAIPTSQIKCAGNERLAEFTPDCGEPECFTRINGQELTMPATASGRRCILTFSTQYNSPQSDVGILLAYSVDGGQCLFRPGPRVIAPSIFDDLPNLGTSTLVSRITLDKNQHTIVPCIAQNSPGAPSSVGRRCLTIECRTQ